MKTKTILTMALAFFLCFSASYSFESDEDSAAVDSAKTEKSENLNDYDFVFFGGAGAHEVIEEFLHKYYHPGVIMNCGCELPLNSQSDIAIEAQYYHWWAYKDSYFESGIKTLDNKYGISLSLKFYLDYFSKRYRPSINFCIHIPYEPLFTGGIGFNFEYVIKKTLSIEAVARTYAELNFEGDIHIPKPKFIAINFKYRI